MSTLINFKSSLDKKFQYLQSSLEKLESDRYSFFENHKPFISRNCYPHGIRFCNILNPLYISESNSSKEFSAFDYIFCQDGFLPLLDFFYRYKRPGKSQTTLLIHEELNFIVPPAWSEYVLTYSIARKPRFNLILDNPKSVYLIAMTTHHETSYENFEKTIDLVNAKFPNAENIKLCLLLRGSPFYLPPKEVRHESFDMIKKAYKTLGIETPIILWQDIVRAKDLNESVYCHIQNNNFVHAYSYIDHFLLTKQTSPLVKTLDPSNSAMMKFDLSVNHEILINESKVQGPSFWNEVEIKAAAYQVEDSLFMTDFYWEAWDIYNQHLVTN